MTNDELELELLALNARLKRLEAAAPKNTRDTFDEYSYVPGEDVVRYRNDALVYLVRDDMPGRVLDEVAAAIIIAHRKAMGDL